MTDKDTLRDYLQSARDALIGKLDGLGEYELRRPLTATGTNLLGLVKHVASVELGYFTEVFDRPTEDLPWFAADAAPNADMWATAEESSADLLAIYRRVWTISDATIAELDLDSPGQVPWWGDRGAVTLFRILVHMIAETDRHAGHADILREQIDGSAGLRSPGDNLPDDDVDWPAYVNRLQQVAESFRLEP